MWDLAEVLERGGKTEEAVTALEKATGGVRAERQRRRGRAGEAAHSANRSSARIVWRREPPRHRRRRLHRLQLRPLLARARIPATASSRSTCSPTRETSRTSRTSATASRSSRATSATASWSSGALREHEIDVVVNFAAESHNSLAVLDPGRFFRTNVLGTQTLLEAARRAGHRALPPRLHLRGLRRPGARRPGARSPRSRRTGPARRTTRRRPAADHAVRAYHETFGLPVTITNCSNNYGPYQFPEKVIPLFATNALDDLPLPLYASTAEPPRVAARRRPLPRDRRGARRGRGRGDLQRRLRRRGERSRRSPTASSS